MTEPIRFCPHCGEQRKSESGGTGLRLARHISKSLPTGIDWIETMKCISCGNSFSLALWRNAPRFSIVRSELPVKFTRPNPSKIDHKFSWSSDESASDDENAYTSVEVVDEPNIEVEKLEGVWL